ncbi:MAG: nuclear transport factor 2 family protein [Halioglobus sp.]|nr:nuclear transport factor 2 family protein [Halioglobus sp.]
MQSALDITMAYAAAFEETYADDDWSRLERYFAQDAVYEVTGGPLACRLEGRDAILAGMKKSLDTLDRRCDKRHIRLIDGPHASDTDSGGQVAMSWHVSYERGDAPREGFPGRSVVQVADGRITSLQDIYRDSDMEPFVAWMARYGEGLDGRYI